jgi:hypothetical protein
MCCFSKVTVPFWERLFARPIRVFDTRIFARLDGGVEWLAYSMELATAGDVAMVLPVPIVPRSGDDALTFVSLEGYADLFVDLERAFEPPVSQSWDPLRDGVLSAAPKQLVVHQVGAFEASFVPTRADFSRLDPRFHLADELWDRLPLYRDYGFAVFKLKRGARQRIHPMAFRFPTRAPDRLFFPTVHVHDGRVHERADFRHALYFQGPFEGEQRSLGDARMYVATSRAQGLVIDEAPLYRRELIGSLENRDTWIDAIAPRAAAA